MLRIGAKHSGGKGRGIDVRIVRDLAIAAVLICSAVGARADDAARAAAAEHWRSLARLDLDAAYALLKDNHPAMVPELGDSAFIARIDAAYAEAQKRIASIDNFYGLRAVLEGFGNASGDKHVGAGFGLMRQYPLWPNFLVSQRGRDYVVVRASGGRKDAQPADGARLVACDGVPADAFAQARIGAFHANWDIEAQRASQAWRLFVNDRNPFVQPPKTCRFEANGAQKDIEIAWSASSYDVIAPVIDKSSARASAGFGVRRLPNGAYWIAMEQLDNDAEAVIAAATKQAAALRAAPYVVVDVRGNGGGSSSYGDRLAELLLGPAPKESGGDQAGGEAWRVSPGNALAMKQFAAEARASGSNDGIVTWAEETAAMIEKALKAQVRFAPALPMPLPSAPAFVDPRGGSPGTAHVYLLTDYSCFSSCLLMTQTFKARGAAHVGLPTDAATRYMETRAEILPSKLASFSILQKVSLGAPAWIGPFEPVARFDGDIADTAALERWIAGLRAKN